MQWSVVMYAAVFLAYKQKEFFYLACRTSELDQVRNSYLVQPQNVIRERVWRKISKVRKIEKKQLVCHGHIKWMDTKKDCQDRFWVTILKQNKYEYFEEYEEKTSKLRWKTFSASIVFFWGLRNIEGISTCFFD